MKKGLLFVLPKAQVVTVVVVVAVVVVVVVEGVVTALTDFHTALNPFLVITLSE